LYIKITKNYIFNSKGNFNIIIVDLKNHFGDEYHLGQIWEQIIMYVI